MGYKQQCNDPHVPHAKGLPTKLSTEHDSPEESKRCIHHNPRTRAFVKRNTAVFPTSQVSAPRQGAQRTVLNFVAQTGR